MVVAVLAGTGWAIFRLGGPRFEGQPLSSVLHRSYQNGPLETGNAGVAFPVPGDEMSRKGFSTPPCCRKSYGESRAARGKRRRFP